MSLIPCTPSPRLIMIDPPTKTEFPPGTPLMVGEIRTLTSIQGRTDRIPAIHPLTPGGTTEILGIQEDIVTPGIIQTEDPHPQAIEKDT